MHENHQREQYFFAESTLGQLANIVRQHERPVLLCCPMLGVYLHERGVKATVLDIDERFSHLPDFRVWNAYKPEPLDFQPDIIVADPPFNILKLDQLFHALRTLGGLNAHLLVSFLKHRTNAIQGALAAFGLADTGWTPRYVSTTPNATFFANFEVPPCS